MNVFLELVEKRSVVSEEGLKRVYRSLVKRLHPDSGGDALKPADLDKLKAEFREALARLSEIESARDSARARAALSGAAMSREDFLEEFRDLVARGFPLRRRAAEKNKEYRKCIQRCAAHLAAVFGDPLFLEAIDAQFSELRGPLPFVWRNCMQAVWNRFDFAATGLELFAKQARQHYGFIEKDLERLRYFQARSFLDYLTAM